MSNNVNHLQPSNRYISYTADGFTVKYTVPFAIWSADDITVYVNDQAVAITDYVVSNFGDVSGGLVTFVAAPEDGATVAIWGTMPRERDVDYNQYATLTADAMNLDQNVQEAQIQENTRDIRRGLISDPADGIPDPSLVTLPPASERANSYFIWGENGEPAALGGINRGHTIANQLEPFPYEKYLNFSDSFELTDSPSTNSTDVELSMGLSTIGDGHHVVAGWSSPSVLSARSLTAGNNVLITNGEDGSIEIAMAGLLQFEDSFAASEWSNANTLTYTPDEHGLGATSGLWAKCTDLDGWDVAVNTRCTPAGVVTIQCDRPFSGTVQIMAGYGAGGSGMVNPLRMTGDIIYASNNEGAADRLPIGTDGQVLSITDGLPDWVSLGAASRVGVNVAGGAVLLDNDLMIPDEYLPYNSMTYKGTFGSASSSTGGDLPSSGVLDGDIYICVADSVYASTVAGISFDPGQWAIYDGTAWQAITVPVSSGKANVDASNLSDANVTSWREKLVIGGGLAGETYSTLSNNTVYQAQTDILVVASGNLGNVNNVYTYIYVGDTPSTVTTIIAQAKSNNKYGDIPCLTAKVPRGRYYKVYWSSSFGMAYSIGL